MKHWATNYTFDHGGQNAADAAATTTTTTTSSNNRPARSPANNACNVVGEGYEYSGSTDNITNDGNNGVTNDGGEEEPSGHCWSSIVDPYSLHGPGISVHDVSLHSGTVPSASSASDTDDNADAAEADPVRPGPAATPSQQQPPVRPVTAEKADPKSWYADNAQSDWYGATVRMANRTPLQMLGYHSEGDGSDDDYGDGDRVGWRGEDEEADASGSDVSVEAAYIPKRASLDGAPDIRNVYAADDSERQSSHDCANCVKFFGSSLWPKRCQEQPRPIVDDYQSLVGEEYKKIVTTEPVSAAFLPDEDVADREVTDEHTYDAEAKEAQLRAEAALWNTTSPKPARAGDVPTIDVGEWFRTNDEGELHRLGAALRRASQEVGFYQLVGHEIPPLELNAILQQAKLFHSLPKRTKHELAMDMPEHHVGGVGYLGYGNWKLPSRSNPNQNAAYVVKTDHRIAFDDNHWPQEVVLPGFRSAVERYAALAKGLAERLLPIYAVALDLPADYFQVAFEEPFFRLRMTHYRPREGDGESFGIHPHVDTSFITLLITDGTPGLNIFSRRRNEWIQMPTPRPNAFIVNSGELLRQWSNDKFLSTRHFVTNASKRDGYSVPFFFTPNSDCKMECLPTCCGADNPPKYPPFSYNESQGRVQGE